MSDPLDPTVFDYWDDSGNAWTLSGLKLRCEPVATIASGGSPVRETELSMDQSLQLAALFETALANRLFRLEKPAFGAARLRKRSAEAETVGAYLAMRSPDKKKIESLLAKLLAAV